jgi:predicted nucleic acid-binding protein
VEEREVKLLFDSSAIFEAVRLGSKALDLLKGNFTTTLAYYELGNILWKYEGKLNVEIVFSAMKKVLPLMEVIEVGLDKEVLDEAFKRGLTYYDSAYLVTAKRLGVGLVSLDKDLIRNGAVGLEDILRKWLHS